MERLIENLTEQLQKVTKEHPIEVNNDTYWRGVKIGLETAIEVALYLKSESTSDVVDTFFCQHKLVLDCKEQCHKCKTYSLWRGRHCQTRRRL